MSVDEGWVPAACTLPTVEQPFRVREFDELFAEALVGVDRVAPTRLRLVLAGGAAVVARARDLAERERECCSFFTFSVTAHGHGATLEVGVPAAQVDVLDALAVRAGRAAA
jgi:hypothetical protein